MNLDLVKKNVFGIWLGVFVLGSAALWKFGIQPTRSANRDLGDKLQADRRQIETYQKTAKDLPSPKVVRVHEDHRKWLSDQYVASIDILREMDDALEKPMIMGPDTSPQWFKAKYGDVKKAIIERTAQFAVDPGRLFRSYRWEGSKDFPAPSEYEAIEKYLHIMDFLTQVMASGRATRGRSGFPGLKLEQMPLSERPSALRGKGVTVEKDPRAFDVYDAEIHVQIRASDVVRFLSAFLAAGKGAPPTRVRAARIEKLREDEAGGKATMVRLTVNVEVLDFIFKAKTG